MIPNNLIRTMACLPQLGLTEVDYANSFIFDESTYGSWPDPAGSEQSVMFPMAGFVDRVTKELVINLVSLLNRSRYSITHHTVIGFSTLSQAEGPPKAEQMLLKLVNSDGEATFEHRGDLYSNFQIETLKFALKVRERAHSVSDDDFVRLKELCELEATSMLENKAELATQELASTPEYKQAFVNGMLVELTWCIVHFSGLLNTWFTLIKVMDETDEQRDGINFVGVYNDVVPESIKVRNNALLGADGWGNN